MTNQPSPPDYSRNPPPVAARRRASNPAEIQKPASTVPWWIDWIILVVSIGAIGIFTAAQTIGSGVSLTTDTRLSWHLVRAAGLTAYTLLSASTLWGIFLASRVIKDWSPGQLSLVLHATASWLGVLLVIIHMALLLFDTYYTYTISNLLIPFTGPYRPIWTGLGTIAMFLLIAITLSFSFRKLIGQKAWRLLHYMSYVTFALSTVHALFAGTDGTSTGMRLMLGIFCTVVFVLFTVRIRQTLNDRRLRVVNRIA
jgi:methionine sulfoxide reductase heme-binding subunit